MLKSNNGNVMFHAKNISLIPAVLVALTVILSSCSTKQVIYNPSAEAPEEEKPTTTIKAKLSKQQPRETVIVYEAESPELYTVQKGDTLWDISSHFLRDPWFWPEIWYKNPQIDNPHLIYPGDQLAIIYVGGKKKVQLVKRADDESLEPIPLIDRPTSLKVVKISPRIHSKTIDSTIPNIPIESIRQFLVRPLLIDEEELANSAYILDSQNSHLANSAGDTIYVRGIKPEANKGKYNIFRPNKPMRDPVTDEIYGYEALYLGEAKIIKHGDPASLFITSSTREILRDDRLISVNNADIDRDYFPTPPKEKMEGQVISILGGISQIGQFSTIAVNLGQRDDLQVGHLIQINRQGQAIRDESEEDPDFLIKLPDERSALAIVVKSYEKMSYCLILEANTPVKAGDLVVTP
ncbi:MAG: LysM peptidoglycan-binding domain-containing protein [Gammaproteobacteria bacterium]|nr:LysM peptidoglycan-binding domain-containing protein [Gammaproteobacteria bacterium]